MIDPSLFWETLLVTLRGQIISYAKKAKRESKNKERELEKSITELNNIVNTGQYSKELCNSLISKNQEFLEMRKTELNGMLIRSRANWLEYGEKASKFFLNLETNNTINRNMQELETD